MIGALALTIGLVGCKNYGGDIDKICERLDVVESDIDDIQEQLKNGFVVKIEQKANTPGEVILNIYYSGNETPTELKLALPVNFCFVDATNLSAFHLLRPYYS